MIITRTPLRISFAGGGSDLPVYYLKHGGAVVSTSINKYVYLSIYPYFHQNGYLLKYTRSEHVSTIKEIQHPILHQVFKDFNVKGVDFNSCADIPSGTGLGSSSAFTVGLALLCNTYTEGRYISREELAAYACDVEINKLGDPIGKQDQYACAVGGLNFIQFHPDESVTIEKLCLCREGKERLQKNLLLFYTGTTRAAMEILAEQKDNTMNNVQISETLSQMVNLAFELRKALLNNNINIMGEILHENWELKRQLASGVTNEKIDNWYKKALYAGAIGGKLLGAGGGGFLLFYVQEENHNRVRRALSDLREIDFTFDQVGATIVYQQ